jgi:hypothetical protein
MKLTIIDSAYHRNGVTGTPFHVVLFEDHGPDGSRKLAILFGEPDCCAVLDVAKLAAGDIAFGSNSWRGDTYAPHLRSAMKAHLKAFVNSLRKQQWQEAPVPTTAATDISSTPSERN